MSIEEHEFSDAISELHCTNADDETVTLKHKETSWLFMDKLDSIAMAQHFKLTADDLIK